MSQDLAFGGLGAPVAITAPNGSSSASTALPGVGGDACLIQNLMANSISVEFSNVSGGAVAGATNIIIRNASFRVVAMPIDTVDVAVRGLGGTGTVYFQRGSGT